MKMTSPVLSKTSAILALALAVILGAAAPSMAAQPKPPLAESSPEDVDLRDNRAQLELLANYQSAREIARILRSPGEVEILVDSDTGDVLSAVELDGLILPFALSPLGPGCTTTSLCMTATTNVPYGYTGTGTLSLTWSSIKQVKTGDRRGAFTWNGIRNEYRANVIANLTTPVTITKIERL